LGHGLEHEDAGHDRERREVVGQVLLAEGEHLGRRQPFAGLPFVDAIDQVEAHASPSRRRRRRAAVAPGWIDRGKREDTVQSPVAARASHAKPAGSAKPAKTNRSDGDESMSIYESAIQHFAEAPRPQNRAREGKTDGSAASSTRSRSGNLPPSPISHPHPKYRGPRTSHPS